MNRLEHYDYRVTWSPEDEVYIARVTEFDSLSAHGDTPEEALQELCLVLEFVLSDLEKEEE